MGMAETSGIALNEDDSHFFATRAGQPLDGTMVDAWVDQYAGTQVAELMLCPNCMRTSYASEVWDPIWLGYDPDGPDDQPLLASSPPQERSRHRKWIHTAWQLHEAGIDVYERWIRRCRRWGISPWISMRMNDVHIVDDERSFIHSEFWRSNPHLRRVPYRFSTSVDRAFDYARPEVREYHLLLIRELVARYDMDGLELDWMRFGFHLRPGYEAEGAGILSQFTSEVRQVLDAWQEKRGHPIRLGVRVPSRPQTALGLGIDAVNWALEGLVDMIVITPFFQTIEMDMPIEIWRQLLDSTNVLLAAGLEVQLSPHPGAVPQRNTLETVRGAAASFLDRGVDRIYLFNYFDSETAMQDLEHYLTLLREVGSLDTMRGKVRRHVLTYADTWAPGEPQAVSLPVTCNPGEWKAFRLHTGPKPDSGRVVVVLAAVPDDAADGQSLQVRVNGESCTYLGPVDTGKPKPPSPAYAYRVPLFAMHRGYVLIEATSGRQVTFNWIEIMVEP